VCGDDAGCGGDDDHKFGGVGISFEEREKEKKRK
jgi:hypothetical protein